jgi:hypothetical protein
MSSTILSAQVRARLWFDRIRESEFGQGAAEYAGIVVVALGVVAAVVAAFSGFDIKQKVIDALTSVFGAPAG